MPTLGARLCHMRSRICVKFGAFGHPEALSHDLFDLGLGLGCHSALISGVCVTPCFPDRLLSISGSRGQGKEAHSMAVTSYCWGLNVFARLLSGPCCRGMSGLNPEWSEQIQALQSPLKSQRDAGELVPLCIYFKRFP